MTEKPASGSALLPLPTPTTDDPRRQVRARPRKHAALTILYPRPLPAQPLRTTTPRCAAVLPRSRATLPPTATATPPLPLRCYRTVSHRHGCYVYADGGEQRAASPFQLSRPRRPTTRDARPRCCCCQHALRLPLNFPSILAQTSLAGASHTFKPSNIATTQTATPAAATPAAATPAAVAPAAATPAAATPATTRRCPPLLPPTAATARLAAAHRGHTRQYPPLPAAATTRRCHRRTSARPAATPTAASPPRPRLHVKPSPKGGGRSPPQ